MKTVIIKDVAVTLLVVLFAYTATSKFLEHELFVFQMRLAPLPGMIFFAPFLGWVMPSIEMLIVIGLLTSQFRLTALYASVILLTTFEFYIAGMLLTHQHLPCTCGGIISMMSWKQHLLFNAIFIVIAFKALLKLKKEKSTGHQKFDPEDFKDLSRA